MICFDSFARETEYCKVVPVEVSREDRRPQVARADIPPHYLSADYYFVEPPGQAKAFQEWCARGFTREYEGRRARHQGEGTTQRSDPLRG